jgi:hypothetical protein
MDGYRVVSAHGKGVGRVVGVDDEFVIVELGRFRRVRRPVPLAFAHPDDSAKLVRITVPRHDLERAPRVRTAVDAEAAAAHYGLRPAAATSTPR